MKDVKIILQYLALYLLLIPSSFAVSPNNFNDTAINDKIAKIAQSTNSIMGVTAIHIESNKTVSYNGGVPFFMASTVKVPIALTLLKDVDERRKTLDDTLQLNSNHSVPGTGNLRHALKKRNVKISLNRLLVLMLTVSDNSASDAILREVNGPSAVLQRLKKFGFNGILVNRFLLEVFLDAHGANHALLQKPHTAQSIQKAFNFIPMSRQITAWSRLATDPRDTATPNDMAFLLAELYRGHLLSPAGTQLLLRIMENCRTGRQRIKKLLPAKTIVAHKTGTWTTGTKPFIEYPGSDQLYRFASDVGIISLPDNKGHIALAVYIKSKGIDDQRRNQAIASVSKLIYNYFVKKDNTIYTGPLKKSSVARERRGRS